MVVPPLRKAAAFLRNGWGKLSAGAVRSARVFIWVSSSWIARQPRLSSSCARVRAPMMGEVIPGWRQTQWSATWAGVAPICPAMATTASITSKARSSRRFMPWFWRALLSARSSRRYVPGGSRERSGLQRGGPRPPSPPRAERSPGGQPQPQSPRHGEVLPLDGAPQQGVFQLQGNHRLPVVQGRQALGLGGFPRRGIGEADMAHLAGTHQVIEGAEGFLDGGVAIPEVHPVQVDVVRLQAAQGFLAGPEDILAARAAGVGVAGAHVGEKLGGDHHLVALYRVAADMVADDFLRVSPTVAVGGVDEVAAQFPVAVHHPIAFPGANADAPVLAEGHGAEAQGADTQAGAAEGNVVVEGHRGFLQRCSWGLAPTAREG